MAKILHISKYYLPFRGGVEGVVNSLALAAVEEGHNVRVIPATHQKGLSSFEIIDGIEIYRLKTFFTFASQPIALGYILSMRQHLKWADIVYVHTPNPLAEVAMLFLAPSKTKIFILHHCDIIKQRFLKKLFYPFQFLFYKKATKIIVATINHITYSDICSSFKEKCEVIPFGFRENTTNYDDSSVIKEKFALFVGRLVSYKGVDVLINSFKKINEKLIIVGTGPLLDDLRKLVTDLSLEDKVSLVGQVSDSQLKNYYRQCHFLVLPSVTEAENFGLVQVEAMSYKKAVIATNLKSGASTIVEDNVTGFLVTPADDLELAQKMNALFDSSTLAKDMGEKGYKRFDQLYSHRKMKDSHQKLILSCMVKNDIGANFANTKKYQGN